MTSLNVMLHSINEESRLSLLCDNFSYLSTEERAGVLFTTADDVNIFIAHKYFLFKLYKICLGGGGLHHNSRLWRARLQEGVDLPSAGE